MKDPLLEDISNLIGLECNLVTPGVRLYLYTACKNSTNGKLGFSSCSWVVVARMSSRSGDRTPRSWLRCLLTTVCWQFFRRRDISNIHLLTVNVGPLAWISTHDDHRWLQTRAANLTKAEINKEMKCVSRGFDLPNCVARFSMFHGPVSDIARL